MFKGIVIKEQNKDRIEKAIKAEEGKARERVLTYDDIVQAVSKVDSEMGISKKNMKGIKVEVDVNAQSFPSAYKWTPHSTHFMAEHTGTGWKILNIFRGACWAGNTTIKVYHMPDTAKEAIIKSKMAF